MVPPFGGYNLAINPYDFMVGLASMFRKSLFLFSFAKRYFLKTLNRSVETLGPEALLSF